MPVWNYSEKDFKGQIEDKSKSVEFHLHIYYKEQAALMLRCFLHDIRW